MLRQINTALGKDMGRVKRYLLHKNTNENTVYLDNYPKVILLDSSETLYNKLTKMDERIFIADPFGKIILGYENDFIAKGLLKDIKKLLKFSKRQIMDDSMISKLSFLGAAFTLFVISLGAWVRLTDAGLGCPDWPGCYGLLTTPCLLYTSPSPRDLSTSRMPSSA